MVVRKTHFLQLCTVFSPLVVFFPPALLQGFLTVTSHSPLLECLFPFLSLNSLLFFSCFLALLLPWRFFPYLPRFHVFLSSPLRQSFHGLFLTYSYASFPCFMILSAPPKFQLFSSFPSPTKSNFFLSFPLPPLTQVKNSSFSSSVLPPP